MSGSDEGSKPAQTGLVDMGDITFYAASGNPNPNFTISDLTDYPGSFSEIVLNVTWAELQPTENGPLDTSAIDSAICAVQAYNAANGTDVGIKLRVWGGFAAPEWAQTIDGPAVTVTGPHTVNPNDDNSVNIGRFWTADYIDAWTSLQNQLAADYDSNPVIRGISNTAGAAATDEPFVPLQPDQMSELESGGYTNAAEELTLRAAIADYSAWPTTPLDYTMNLFHLEDGPQVTGDENFTLAVLQEAENSARLVQAGNHALNNPLYQPDSFVYAQLAEDAALDPATVPGSYQTASPSKLALLTLNGPGEPGWGAYAKWPSTVSNGVAAYAGDIELWDLVQNGVATGFTGLTPSQVQYLAAILAAGTPPTTGAPDDGAALGFIAPASVRGAAGTIAFTGVDAVLLASATSASTYTITITSTHGGTLSVSDFYGIVTGATSGSSLSLAGTLGEVNTVLASLTDTIASGTDIVQVTASDGIGNTALRSVGVAVSAPASSSDPSTPQAPSTAASATAGTYTWTGGGTNALFSNQANWAPTGGPPGAADTALFTTAASPDPAFLAGTGAVAGLTVDDTLALAGNSTITVGQNGTGDLEIADQPGTTGTLILGGVESTLAAAGNLDIGQGGLLLASLAPGAYSTASLTIGGALAVEDGGTARVEGALSAGAIDIAAGGTFAGDGTLAATGPGPIINDGTIEAAADLTLGLQQLTLADPVAGTGTLFIDSGASLILAAAAGAGESIVFAPNSIFQLSYDPYSPSTLELEKPFGMQGTISGFSFADSLVLDGVTATAASYDTADDTLSVQTGGGTLSFSLSGNLAGLTPAFAISGSGADAQSTITFVAPTTGAPPSVSAPASLEGAADVAVPVPDIVLAMPLPSTLPADTDITVTLSALTGSLNVSPLALAAVTPFPLTTAEEEENGALTITPAPDGMTLMLSGTLAAIETGLQSLTYTAASEQPTDTITVTASDYAGTSAPATIQVLNNSAPLVFDWAAPGDGSFADAADWTTGATAPATPPGGTNIAAFGPGTYAVSGDGAIGGIAVTGTTTLTGQVTAQGRDGVAVTVDNGGALTLASGAVLTAGQEAVAGDAGTGTLTLMGGALGLTGEGVAGDLVIGENAASTGTVFDLEQIQAAGAVTVGDGGTGTLKLLGVAASLSDSGADIGALAGAAGTAAVDGGEWTNNGTLTVGDAGFGTLLIGGTSDGISGQVTAYDATIGAGPGGQGSVTLDGGDLLIASANVNAGASTSMLTVGAGGTGLLTINSGGNVTVGEAEGSDGNNTGILVVGGSGQIQIGGDGALLVDGSAIVDGPVTVGRTLDDSALFALSSTLAIDGSGSVTLGGPDTTVRASTVSIASGATLSGTGTLSGDGGGNNTSMLATITNNGAIAAAGGNLLVYGGVTGTGQLSVAGGASLTLQAAVSSGQTLAYSANAETVLDDPRAFAGMITGFSPGDKLDLASTDATKATWSAGVLTLTTSAGPLALDVAGNYAPNAFSVQSDGLGGALVTLAGSGEGDVHMTTFGGVHYNFQVVGEFIAARSTEPGNPFQVQIETAAANGAVSITTALAAALAGTRVTFAVHRADTVWVNGASDTTLHAGAVQSLAGGALAQLSSDTYRLSWSTGESVTIIDRGGYLDWSVLLGSNDGPGSIQGLLGSNDGQASSSSPSESALATAWSVTPDTSLFDAAHTKPDSLAAPATTSSPGNPTAVEPPPIEPLPTASASVDDLIASPSVASSVPVSPQFIYAAGVDPRGAPKAAMAETAANQGTTATESTIEETVAQGASEILASFGWQHLLHDTEPRVPTTRLEGRYSDEASRLHGSAGILKPIVDFAHSSFDTSFATPLPGTVG